MNTIDAVSLIEICEALDDLARLHAAVNDRSFNDGNESGEAGRLGHRHDAAIDAAKDDDWNEKCRHRMQVDLNEALALHRRFDRIALVAGVEHDPGDEQGCLHQPRNYTGEEKPRYAFLGDDGIDDHCQAWRDEDAECAGRANDAERKVALIFARDHGRDQDRTDRDGGCHGGAADRREDRAGHDADERKAAARAADPGLGAIDESIGDAAALHECRRDHEQRDRNQRLGVEVIDDELGE